MRFQLERFLHWMTLATATLGAGCAGAKPDLACTSAASQLSSSGGYL